MKLKTLLIAKAHDVNTTNAKKTVLKADDFETKARFADYTDEVGKLFDRLNAWQRCTSRSNKAAYMRQVEHVITIYDLTAEEKNKVLEHFRGSMTMTTLRPNNDKTAATRQANRIAAEELRAAEEITATTPAEIEAKTRLVAAAQKACDDVKQEYTPEVQKQASAAEFRRVFENQVADVLAGLEQNLIRDTETADESKARKATEEKDVYFKRAAQCNERGAACIEGYKPIDAEAIFKDKGIKTLKETVKETFATILKAEAAAKAKAIEEQAEAEHAIDAEAAPTADTTATTAA